MKTNRLSLSDLLAIERTNLANERTLLAYFRTFIILLSSGLAILKLDFLKQLDSLGVALIVLAPVIMAFSVFRYYRVKAKIGKLG